MENLLLALADPGLASPTNKFLGLGQIVGITSEGRALVDFPGNLRGPQEARSLVTLDPADMAHAGDGLPVVLFFPQQDSQDPIILGVIRNQVGPVGTKTPATLTLGRCGQEVVVDGKSLHVEAHQEIVLQCGQSSLTLRRDGKIILKGTEIVSRASETHKIQGSVVKIN